MEQRPTCASLARIRDACPLKKRVATGATTPSNRHVVRTLALAGKHLVPRLLSGRPLTVETSTAVDRLTRPCSAHASTPPPSMAPPTSARSVVSSWPFPASLRTCLLPQATQRLRKRRDTALPIHATAARSLEANTTQLRRGMRYAPPHPLDIPYQNIYSIF